MPMPCGFIAPLASLPQRTPPNLLRKCPHRHPLRRPRWRACLPPLERAISSGLVQDVGRTVPLSPDGRLSLAGPPDWVPPTPECGSAVSLAVDLLRLQLGASLVSVHVRGSAAAGHLFARSDLDLLVLVADDCDATSSSLARFLSAQIPDKFPFISSVDVGLHVVPASGVGGLPESARFLLLAYGARAAGASLAGQLGRPAPPRDSLVDVRARQRKALDALPAAEGAGWFVKGALRGLVDLAAGVAGRHARDLVPCGRILVDGFPDHAELIRDAVVLACDPEAAVVDRKAAGIICDIADLAEREYLRDAFGDATEDFLVRRPPSIVLNNPSNRTQTHWMHSFASALESVAGAVRRIEIPASFVRDELPPVRLPGTLPVHEECAVTNSPSAGLSEVYLRQHPVPIVFRGALGAATAHLGDSRALTRVMMRSTALADVRLAPGNVFTFCRSSHPLLSSGKLTPPSVLVRTSGTDFFQRLNADARARPPPLRYARERAYMQSAVGPRERLFAIPAGVQVAQGERYWVSAHGAVSPLHFDAAHSALVQVAGRKRMLFFPPEALKWMGVYPSGHPLQRRAAVDLSRPDTRVYNEFWQKGAQLAKEVLLMPGDLVVFPPGWAHYTESLAEKGGLSVSHTLRFFHAEEEHAGS